MNFLPVLALIACSLFVGFWIRGHWDSLGLKDGGVNNSGKKPGVRVFSPAELKRFKDDPIYLAVLGDVYDVTAGRQHYGRDGGYAHFAGVDGSAAYITGKFDKAGVTSNVDELSPEQTLALFDWKKFYDEHAEYKRVGVLNDRFYDENGEPTEHLAEAQRKRDIGLDHKASEKAQKERWPPCNFRSSADDPRIEMWCADRSGGIERGWAGYPRELFDGNRQRRCACVQEKDFGNPLVRAYEGCSEKSRTCYRDREVARQIERKQQKSEL